MHTTSAPDVVERDETPVFLMRVPDELPEIQRGWRELEEIVPLRGRHFFGAVYDGAGEYLVCVRREEGDHFQLERASLPGGRYSRVRLRGEAPAVYAHIGPTLTRLAEQIDEDRTRPVIEHYRRHDEIDLLVPIV